MVVLNGVIANRISLTPKSFVRSTSGRTVAGEGPDEGLDTLSCGGNIARSLL
jgi:hypothetical protein